ncbi:MAG: proline dehydrogenase [Alphaproteobacteria bacterium]|nr:proline dehydrogenase [Alphaproteobacteria bacterium]
MDRNDDPQVGLAAQAGDAVFDTSPPDAQVPASVLRAWKRRAFDRISESLLPVVKHFARPYVGGDTIDDALCVADRLAAEGFATTIGYWDRGRDTARQVTDIALNAIAGMSSRARDSYLSIKPPALRFASGPAQELAEAAAMHHVRLHCDSHGTEAADLANAMLQAMIDRLGGHRLGTTLPGRWRRSLRDAEWAIERALNVRVVKGQWPDPEDQRRDLAAGFLEVIDRLAGRARQVAVATHDAALAQDAITRLRAAGTACELELLFGMPTRPLIRWAKENGVRVRIYVPFGSGFVPSALRILKRNPRLVYAIAKASLTAAVAP